MHARPESMHARPESMHARTELMHARPESMHARTELMHARPESMHARPESMHAPPESMHSRPESMLSRAESMQARTESMQARSESMQARNSSMHGCTERMHHVHQGGLLRADDSCCVNASIDLHSECMMRTAARTHLLAESMSSRADRATRATADLSASPDDRHLIAHEMNRCGGRCDRSARDRDCSADAIHIVTGEMAPFADRSSLRAEDMSTAAARKLLDAEEVSVRTNHLSRSARKMSISSHHTSRCADRVSRRAACSDVCAACPLSLPIEFTFLHISARRFTITCQALTLRSHRESRHRLSFLVHPKHVYIHVPFCARRCVYCDFAIAVRRHVPVDDYLAAIERELTVRFPDEGAWPVETLYFGGGTPSRLGGEGIARLLETVQRRITIDPGAEVTLEANPEDVSLDAARAWRSAGINRLSLGAQSFDDAVLRWMHRTHDAQTITTAVENARAAGIDDLSLDLIFALPNEVQRNWERDVAAALALEPTHLSLYGLTTEPATPLGRWRDRGVVTEAHEGHYEREYLHAHEALHSAGFEHYEVSNFGLPGRHARHNSMYWRGVPYAGLGPGAHEFDGNIRRWNVDAYVEWTRRLENAIDPVEGQEHLDEESREAERVYLGLRTSDGLRLSGAELVRTQAWIGAGWGTIIDTDLLKLTPLGWLRLDSLAADLTVVRSRS